MRHDTAGDPITGVKWSRRTTRKIAAQLAALGIAVSKNTVGRLLKNMDCKLGVNRQQIASTKNPDGNQQFLYMGQQRERFASQGLPSISVDTKKKEPIGNFKNTGAKWDREPVLVKDHDFRSHADGMAIPYGIYDTQANRGAVFVGTSHDTPAFAVDAIAGLTVNAYLIPENYDTGIKISDAAMRQLNLVPHELLGRWNYTVRPAQNVN
jgi:hypothetical protein